MVIVSTKTVASDFYGCRNEANLRAEVEEQVVRLGGYSLSAHAAHREMECLVGDKPTQKGNTR